MDTTNANTRCGKAVGAKGSPPEGWRSQSAFGFARRSRSSELARKEKERLAGSQADRDTLVGAFLFVICALTLAFSSCNVTRTITTSAQTIQRGDTTVTIMTKTVETYDGQLDAAKLLHK